MIESPNGIVSCIVLDDDTSITSVILLFFSIDTTVTVSNLLLLLLADESIKLFATLCNNTEDALFTISSSIVLQNLSKVSGLDLDLDLDFSLGSHMWVAVDEASILKTKKYV